MTTPTDTPETDAKIVSIECEDSCCAVFVKLGDIELIEDLVPYSHARALERARDAALRELAKWNPIIQEIHRRADKEHAEADNVDFAVTVSIGDYRQAINSAKEAR